MPSSPSKIIICVSGGIAAYKCADLVSGLRKEGAEVRCVLTANASRFVSPLVLETLSGHPALAGLFEKGVSGTEHIRLARWADVLVFAPATANLLARLAHGFADDLVTTVALASRAPWLVAPSMNTVMWEAAATRENVARIRERGARFIEPEVGLLACGETGEGRLPPVERIGAAALALARGQAIPEEYAAPAGARREMRARFGPLASRGASAEKVVGVDRAREFLAGQRILVTAGPTKSRIDAVRYLTNPSTGRMGAALAEAALEAGASVDYVLGVDKGVVEPRVPPAHSGRFRIARVETADEMLARALEWLPGCDGVVAAAAVLDYEVAHPSAVKLKRSADPVSLPLLPAKDVLAGLRRAARGSRRPWFLAFAAETGDSRQDWSKHASEKHERKGVDLLFANPVGQAGVGFGADTNRGILFSRGLAPESIGPAAKLEVARRLLSRAAALGNAP